MYDAQINEYIGSGQAKKLTKQKALKPSEVIKYLLHYGVLVVNKFGKARIVFDAFAKHQNIWFNDNLLPESDLLNNLVLVLVKFPHREYAAMTDIKGMFHQVNVKS